MKLIAHPDNIRILKEELKKNHNPYPRPENVSLLDKQLNIYGIQIVASSDFPLRRIEEVHSLPPDEKFVKWEESDIDYLKFFGKTIVTQVDKGPYYVLMDDIKPVSIPRINHRLGQILKG